MSQSPVRPAWNKSNKVDDKVEPVVSPRKKYGQNPKFSTAVAPYRPTRQNISPRKSPTRQNWARQSVSPDLNQGWK